MTHYKGYDLKTIDKDGGKETHIYLDGLFVGGTISVSPNDKTSVEKAKIKIDIGWFKKSPSERSMVNPYK